MNPEHGGARCFECPLKGKRPVPPSGNVNASVVIVGEAPGAQEEKRGAPFIGPSGLMLNEILDGVGLERSDVWLSNALLCRPEVPDLLGPKRYDLPTYLAWLRKDNNKKKKAAKAAKVPFEPVQSPLECCAPRLWRELNWFEAKAKERGLPNGAVVIPVGNYALQAITGKKGIMKYRGSPLPPLEGAINR